MPVRLLDLGRAPYREVLALQHRLHAAVSAEREPATWIVVEHEPVVTLGRKADAAHVLVSRDRLAARGIDVVEIERGGDVTYHGPGHVVVYPIVKLARFREVVPFVDKLEAAAVGACATFGIAARGRSEHRGVYVGDRAIAAVGLTVRAMTTMHGMAFNVAPALDYDRIILPCGTPQFGLTSIARELGRPVSWEAGRDALLAALAEVFGIGFEPAAANIGLRSAS